MPVENHAPPLLPCVSLTLQDGRWVKEEEMSASLRETDEPSTWFRCLSSPGLAVAQLSGQIAMASCDQLDPFLNRRLPQQSSLLHL